MCETDKPMSGGSFTIESLRFTHGLVLPPRITGLFQLVQITFLPDFHLLPSHYQGLHGTLARFCPPTEHSSTITRHHTLARYVKIQR